MWITDTGFKTISDQNIEYVVGAETQNIIKVGYPLRIKIINEMHDILQESNLNEKGRLDKIELEYHKLACERGAIIKEIVQIERQEDKHFLFEDADFSLVTIKKLIEGGQNDAQDVLQKQKRMD